MTRIASATALRRNALPAIAALAAVGGVSAPAQANNIALTMPAAMVQSLQQECTSSTPAPVVPQLAATKAAAILDGQMSALDRIRAQQALAAAPPPAPAAVAQAVPVQSCTYTALNVAAPVAVQQPLVQAVAPAAPVPVTDPDNYLASARIPIGVTRFEGDWARVSASRLGQARTRRLLAGSAGDTLLARVNSYVNTAIAHVEDRDLYATGDYWATARETLSRGRGDCEDFAILKMQMLAAMGVAREDMFLTLARDLARNADHAVLIVRHEGGWHMLDNATDAVLPAGAQTYDYRPMFSYSGSSSYLHGAQQAAPAISLAYLSVSD